MRVKHICAVIFFFLLGIAVHVRADIAAEIFTECGTQVQRAMGGSTYLPVIDISTVSVDHDSDAGTPDVLQTTLILEFGGSAQAHALARPVNCTGIGNTTIPCTYETSSTPVVNYVGIPYPWCTFDVTSDCADYLVFGSDRDYVSSGCALVDKDEGPPERLAGRLFVVPTQSPACLLSGVTIQFLGAGSSSADPGDIDVYTYDFEGLRDGVVVTPAEAVHVDYKADSCSLSDGYDITPTDPEGQVICGTGGISLQCPLASRPLGVDQGPRVELHIQCIGRGPIPDAAAVAEDRTVWAVINYESTSAVIYSEYDLRFLDTETGPVLDEYNDELVPPSNLRQYVSPSTSFGSYIERRMRSNELRSERDTDIINRDYLIYAIPPCICGFSLACTGGSGSGPELVTLVPYSAANQPPVAVITPLANGTNAVDVRPVVSNTTDTPDGSGSNDPDGAPLPLLYYWYQSDGPGVLVIDDYDTATPNITFPTEEGEYTVILYVSDGQDVDYEVITYDVTAARPQVVIVVSPSNRVVPNTTVTIDASGTYDEDGGPSPLEFYWTQTLGFTVPLNDTALPNGSIVSGLFTMIDSYIFMVRVTDGQFNSTASVPIYVSSTLPVPPPPPSAPPPTACESPPINGTCYSLSFQCGVYNRTVDPTPGLCEPGDYCCLPASYVPPPPSPSPSPSPGPGPSPSPSPGPGPGTSPTPSSPVPPGTEGPGASSGGDDRFPPPTILELGGTSLLFLAMGTASVLMVGVLCNSELWYGGLEYTPSGKRVRGEMLTFYESDRIGTAKLARRRERSSIF